MENKWKFLPRILKPNNNVFTNETEITEKNIKKIVELALRQAEDFWSQNPITQESAKDIKIVLVDSDSETPELPTSDSDALKCQLLASIFFSIEGNKIYINTKQLMKLFKEKNNIRFSALEITAGIFHETVHFMQNRMGVDFVSYFLSREFGTFGLTEDTADMMVGAFFFYLEKEGKTDNGDFDDLIILHRKIGFTKNNTFKQGDRGKGGHGNPDIREENFINGYKLAKQNGTNKAIVLILSKLNV